jgi:hypothetical protein
MALAIGSHYGISRETVKTINALAIRVRNNLDSTVPYDLFGGLYTINRWNAANFDKMFKAVNTADSLKPDRLFAVAGFGYSAGHFHNLNRVVMAALVALEARVTALGH